MYHGDTSQIGQVRSPFHYLDIREKIYDGDSSQIEKIDLHRSHRSRSPFDHIDIWGQIFSWRYGDASQIGQIRFPFHYPYDVHDPDNVAGWESYIRSA